MEYFIAFYISGVVLAMLKLYMPCFWVIKDTDPNNPIIKHNWMACWIMFLGFMIILIPLTPALLSDKLGKSFCVTFCDAVLNQR